MNLQEFAKYLMWCADECNTHPISHELTFRLATGEELVLDFNSDENYTYAFEINKLLGCGCCNDVEIKLRKKKLE